MTEKEHLLVCLGEECAEVIVNADKALRFGLGDHHPDKTLDNFGLIAHELNDLYGVIELLAEHGVCFTPNSRKIEAKKKKVKHYMEYARVIGAITEEQLVTTY